MKQRDLAHGLAVVKEGTDGIDDWSAKGVMRNQYRHAETEIVAAFRLHGLLTPLSWSAVSILWWSLDIMAEPPWSIIAP